eukprot:12121.XXX_284469_281386_1 [CDS] Oithona nana genome sequencing.
MKCQSWILALIGLGLVEANPDAKRLYDDLLSNYNRLIRPVVNHTQKVTVKLGLRLSQLVDLNLKDQILTTNVWLEHEWHDYKFSWDPAEYGGVTEIYVPSEHIWLPDIILYNNADGDYIVKTMTKAILHHDGKVVWAPPAIFKSSCEIDVEFFPFDKQICFLKFGSWSHDGFQVDLIHINSVPGNNTVSYGMDLSEYYLNVEWDILSVPSERHVKKYPCCPEPYPDIYFNMVIRRKPLFYIVNLIIPCVGIFYLSILVFYLPAQSKQKTALVIAILVSQTLYFTLIIEVIPATSLTLPLLGRYLLFSMVWIAIAVLLTTIVINLHYRQPSTHTMPSWVRKVFIQKLPRILLMRVPIQVIKDSMGTRRSKFLRQSDPALKSLTGEEDEEMAEAEKAALNGNHGGKPGGENGNNGGAGAGGKADFKSHLNSLYNGLAKIMSSTCQVEKEEIPKAPFAVEKAVHNIIFIKHHMKRQDEFEAEDQDWGIVAMVLDRLFLYVFGITAVCGTFMILSAEPQMEDDAHPIDVIYSKIAAEESRMFEEKLFA